MQADISVENPRREREGGSEEGSEEGGRERRLGGDAKEEWGEGEGEKSESGARWSEQEPNESPTHHGMMVQDRITFER
jgi:hypothetical protein